MSTSKITKFFLTSSRRSNPPPSPPDNPVPPPQLGVGVIEGTVRVNVDGPLPYTVLPKIFKKVTEFILINLIHQFPQLEVSSMYFYNQLQLSLLHSSPYYESRRGDIFDRLSVVTVIQSYTSSSCLPIPFAPYSYSNRGSWEINGDHPFPWIVESLPDLTLSASTIDHRDHLKGRGFNPIPRPSPKVKNKIKRLIHTSKKPLSLQLDSVTNLVSALTEGKEDGAQED